MGLEFIANSPSYAKGTILAITKLLTNQRLCGRLGRTLPSSIAN